MYFCSRRWSASQLENTFSVTVANKLSDAVVKRRLLDKISGNRCRFVRIVHREHHGLRAHFANRAKQRRRRAHTGCSDQDVRSDVRRRRPLKTNTVRINRETAIKPPAQIRQAFAHVTQDDLQRGEAVEDATKSSRNAWLPVSTPQPHAAPVNSG